MQLNEVSMVSAPPVSRTFYDVLSAFFLWNLFVGFFSYWSAWFPMSKAITLDGIDEGPRRPYLQRWHMIPRNRWFNIYLHIFVHGDDDRALHDHAWNSWSLILSDRYYEITEIRVERGTATGVELYELMHPADGRELLSQTYDGDTNEDVFRFEQRFTEGDWRKLPRPHPHFLKLEGPNNDQPCMTLFITSERLTRWFFHCKEGKRDFEQYLAEHPTRKNATVGCD